MVIDWAEGVRSALHGGDYRFVSPYLTGKRLMTGAEGHPRVLAGRRSLLLVAEGERGPVAVRLYRHEAPHAAHRFGVVRRTLQALSASELGWLSYEPVAIEIAGQRLPAGIRPWIEGSPLLSYLKQRGQRYDARRGVQGGLRRAAMTLRAAGIAHGNIHPGNVIVDRNGRVHLVDIEGMFTPALRTVGMLIQPPPEFRRQVAPFQFDESMDNLAIARIMLGVDLLRFSGAPKQLKAEAEWIAPLKLLQTSYAPLAEGKSLKELYDESRKWPMRLALRAADELHESNKSLAVSLDPISAVLASEREARKAMGVHRDIPVVGALDIEALKVRVGWETLVVGYVASSGHSMRQAYLNFGHRTDPCFTVGLETTLSSRWPGQSSLREVAGVYRHRWVAVLGKPIAGGFGSPRRPASKRSVSMRVDRMAKIWALDTQTAALLMGRAHQ